MHEVRALTDRLRAATAARAELTRQREAEAEADAERRQEAERQADRDRIAQETRERVAYARAERLTARAHADVRQRERLVCALERLRVGPTPGHTSKMLQAEAR
ncbi:MAG TPA: hypothetical protein VD866_30050 [Urbifossiella sp.]|nr:hypothetical protein [Urbifossiella sp.]